MVIEHDQLIAGIILQQERTDAFLDIPLFVPRGDQHRNDRPFTGGATWRKPSKTARFASTLANISMRRRQRKVVEGHDADARRAREVPHFGKLGVVTN